MTCKINCSKTKEKKHIVRKSRVYQKHVSILQRHQSRFSVLRMLKFYTGHSNIDIFSISWKSRQCLMLSCHVICKVLLLRDHCIAASCMDRLINAWNRDGISWFLHERVSSRGTNAQWREHPLSIDIIVENLSRLYLDSYVERKVGGAIGFSTERMWSVSVPFTDERNYLKTRAQSGLLFLSVKSARSFSLPVSEFTHYSLIKFTQMIERNGVWIAEMSISVFPEIFLFSLSLRRSFCFVRLHVKTFPR